MSNSSHVTIKSSRSGANRISKNALAIEAGDHPPPATSIIKSTLHITPHFPNDRHTLLAEAAYHRAEQRGFDSGHELDDWLAVEMELEQRLADEGRAY